jgi:peptide/nickel transport system permease protein
MPTVTSAAMRFATLVAGLIFIEKVFSYPGMGKLILEAVLNNDYPVLQACFLAFAAVTIVTIFILDLVYARLDPRVRYE